MSVVNRPIGVAELVSGINVSCPRQAASCENVRTMTGTFLGYARVSAADENVDLRSDSEPHSR